MAIPSEAMDLVKRLTTDQLAALRDTVDAELSRREKADSGTPDTSTAQEKKPVETEKCIDSLAPILDPLFNDPVFRGTVAKGFANNA